MKKIVLSAPGMNALSSALMESVIAQLRAANGEPILLTGEGRAFSAGLNLKELLSFDEKGITRFLDLLVTVCEELYHYPGPTVAAINGHAIAGGCLLAMFCDQRVLVNNPKVLMGLNEVALGVSFPPNLLGQIKSLVPPQHHATLLLGGQLHSPERAKYLGLVDHLVEDVVPSSLAILEQLAKLPPVAYRTMKAGLRPMPEDPGLDHQVGPALAKVWGSPDIRARMQALVK